MQGFERVIPIHNTLADVDTITPWDGQDGEEPFEEEFDLSELMDDDGAADEGLCTDPGDSCSRDKSEL